MFHAGIALAGTYGLVERIIPFYGTECGDIALAETALGFGTIGELAHRHEDEALDDLARALGFGIEGLDALDGVAEEIETHGRLPAGRKQIDEAAAHGELAGFHDSARADIARARQSLDEARAIDALGRCQGAKCAAQEFAAWNALKNGVRGREDDCRGLGRASDEACETGHAARDDLGLGADAVIRNSVPGRNGNDARLGREECETGFELFEPAIVGGNMEQRLRRAMNGARFVGNAGEHGRVIAVRCAEDDLLAGHEGGGRCSRLGGLSLSHRTCLVGAGANAVEDLNVAQQIGQRAAVERLAHHEPALKLGVREREQLLEGREVVRGHTGKPRLGITPEQEIHFLGAAMLGAVEGAAAARFIGRHLNRRSSAHPASQIGGQCRRIVSRLRNPLRPARPKAAGSVDGSNCPGTGPPDDLRL